MIICHHEGFIIIVSIIIIAIRNFQQYAYLFNLNRIRH